MGSRDQTEVVRRDRLDELIWDPICVTARCHPRVARQTVRPQPRQRWRSNACCTEGRRSRDPARSDRFGRPASAWCYACLTPALRGRRSGPPASAALGGPVLGRPRSSAGGAETTEPVGDALLVAQPAGSHSTETRRCDCGHSALRSRVPAAAPTRTVDRCAPETRNRRCGAGLGGRDGLARDRPSAMSARLVASTHVVEIGASRHRIAAAADDRLQRSAWGPASAGDCCRRGRRGWRRRSGT